MDAADSKTRRGLQAETMNIEPDVKCLQCGWQESFRINYTLLCAVASPDAVLSPNAQIALLHGQRRSMIKLLRSNHELQNLRRLWLSCI